MKHTDQASGSANSESAFQRRAVYFIDSDCVEYVSEDCFTVYDRVDDFLTLIFDETALKLVGFKLKGFRYFFDNHLKPLFKLNDEQFVDVVSIIETRCTALGEQFLSDDRKRRSYAAARKLAANDNVQIDGLELRVAA